MKCDAKITKKMDIGENFVDLFLVLSENIIFASYN